MERETPTQSETSPVTTPDENKTTSPEGSTSLNIGGQDYAMSGIAEEYHRQSVSGARWFFWIAALSMINSIISLMDGQWNFLAGLGMTQVISGLAIALSQDLGSAVTVVALVLDVLVAGVFVALGLFAQKGHSWAFIVGIVIYAFDGLIFLLVQDWFSLAFHGFVLFCLIRGLMAQNKWKQEQREVPAIT
ncbi:MAG: hypothetical protein ND895_00940 [Pyrinomonadaceae bacterium]|nr:hypothetical protein [Pyrinomonadaceae bacterium]